MLIVFPNQILGTILTQQEEVNNELTNYLRDRKRGRGLQRECQTNKAINKEMPKDSITERKLGSYRRR